MLSAIVDLPIMTIAGMPGNDINPTPELIPRLMVIISELPWVKIIGQIWVFGHKLLRGLSSEGMYEVLDFVSELELKDRHGREAIFKKQEKVRYLQDNIIAFQDQGWGDGRIFMNYRCTPGTPVDRYRSGYKTHILISLREVKNKGDVDEFNIEWGIKQGFLLKTGFWATEISHKARRFTVKVIFPKTRPPIWVSILERNRQRTHILEENAKSRLPDGRWLITWENRQPRRYEHYILNWEW